MFLISSLVLLITCLSSFLQTHTDMEALSAQLMNHLSSMQQLENGSIFLDDVLGGGGIGGGGGGGGGDHPRRFLRGERSVDSTSSTSALLGGHHHHHHHHPIEVRCVYLDELLGE